MSQGTLDVQGNVVGSTYSANMRTALAALGTCFAGASAPAATGQPFAHQLWMDTATGRLKQRNAGGTAWVAVALMDGWLGNAVSKGFRAQVLNADLTALVVAADLLSIEGTLISGFSATLDTNTASGGINALDTGSWATDTWYGIWSVAAADASQSGLIASTNANPTPPTGYTKKRLVARWKTSGTATNLQKGRMLGNRFDYGSNQTNQSVVGITASFPTSQTSVGLSTWVPTGAVRAFLSAGVEYSGAPTAGAAMYVTDADAAASDGQRLFRLGTGVLRAQMPFAAMVKLADQTITYRMSDATNLSRIDIEVLGYEVDLH